MTRYFFFGIAGDPPERIFNQPDAISKSVHQFHGGELLVSRTRTASIKRIMNVLELHRIRKMYPGGILANDDVSIRLGAGDIHAVLGENGAGKTTIVKILAGILQPDTGHIAINSSPVSFRSPRDAMRVGIGIVHQSFSLVPALTVGENLALGLRHGFWTNIARWYAFIREKSNSLGLPLQPERPVWNLSAGERQRVEVLRLLLQDAKLYVLDEPTSILSPMEEDALFSWVRDSSEKGRLTILVTHKLRHVREVCSHVTVLRKGRVTIQGRVSDFSDAELTEALIGRSEISTKRLSSTVSPQSHRAVLCIKDLSVRNTYGRISLRNVNLTIHAGEVMGVAGVNGNGQQELAGAIVGQCHYTGSVTLCDKEDGAEGISHIGYIPDERLGVAVAPDLTVAENLTLRRYREPQYSRSGIINALSLRKFAEARIRDFNIIIPGLDASVRTLSGGNLQKLILARELDGNPTLLIVVNPTAGLDVGATEMVHQQLLNHAATGSSILLISEDLDEVLTLSNRMVVLFDGNARGVLDTASVDMSSLGLLMSAAVADYIRDIETLDTALAIQLASYPCAQVLRAEVDSNDIDAVVKLATCHTHPDVQLLGISLLDVFCNVREVSEFLLRLWGEELTVENRIALMWSTLQMENVSTEMNEVLYSYCRLHLRDLAAYLKMRYGSDRLVIESVGRNVLQDLDAGTAKWWVLAAVFACGTASLVQSVSAKVSDHKDEFIARVGAELSNEFKDRLCS